MTAVSFSSSFKRAYKNRVKGRKELEKRFWEKVEVFIENPFDKSLKTHKLSGRLKDLWSFKISYDMRVVFYFAEKDNVVFVDMGKHEEVY
jgi:addiction module RelE/StbE family toxin